jgi:hypothetical protein
MGTRMPKLCQHSSTAGQTRKTQLEEHSNYTLQFNLQLDNNAILRRAIR